MTSSLFSQLVGRAELVIKGRGFDFERRVPLSDFSQANFDFSTLVPSGSYRITFAGRVRVVSVFRKDVSFYTCSVGLSSSSRNRCTGIRFALQPLGARSSSLSGGASLSRRGGL